MADRKSRPSVDDEGDQAPFPELEAMIRHPLGRVALVACASLLALGAGGKKSALQVPRAFPTIQAAVDAAVPGDVIKVGKGTYAEAVVIATDGLTLIGRRSVVDPAYAGPCFSVNADDVTINGFTLRNGSLGVSATGDGISLIKNIVEASAGVGLSVTGEGAAVISNAVRAAGGDGIRVRGPVGAFGITGENPSQVHTNKVQQSGEDGIDVVDVNSTIRRNLCTSNGFHGIRSELGGVFVAGGPASLVSGNQGHFNAFDGLQIESYFGTGVDVVTNTTRFNGQDGLRVLGFHFTVNGNRSGNNARHGLCHSGQAAVLSSNRCESNGGVGLMSEGFVSGGDGGVAGDVGITLQSNRCQGNGRDGIHAAGGRFAILGNTSSANLGDGIDLDRLAPGQDPGDGGEPTNLEDNSCKDNGHDGIDNSALGTSIRSNQSSNNGGVDLAGAGDGSGTVATFDSNKFGTGGADAVQLLDL